LISALKIRATWAKLRSRVALQSSADALRATATGYDTTDATVQDTFSGGY
jgi:hypothetical protein